MTKTDFSLLMGAIGLIIALMPMIIRWISQKWNIKSKYGNLLFMCIVMIATLSSTFFIKNYEFLPEDNNMTEEEMLVKAEQYFSLGNYFNAMHIYSSEKLDTNPIALSR